MQTTRHRKSGRRPVLRVSAQRDGILLFLAIFFVAGAVVGALVGALSKSGDLTALLTARSSRGGDVRTVLSALWAASRFHLLVLIAGTSLLGVLFVPMLAALRGYLLSCTAAAVLQGYSWKVLLVLLGIPALFEIPCFLVLAADAVGVSRRLTAGGMHSGKQRETLILRHTLLCLPVLTAGALAETFLLPVLLANCIS